MSVTFNNANVVELVRGFVVEQLTADGDTVQVLPDNFELNGYVFDPTLCPLNYIGAKAQTNKPGPNAWDVTHVVPVSIYHVRLRNSTDAIEEDICEQRVYSLASYFAVNYRLGGNVQMVTPTKIRVGDEAVAGALWLAQQWQAAVAMASLDMDVEWIENYITS